MKRVMVSGFGTHVPDTSISNEDLVASFNAWVDSVNPGRLAAGLDPLSRSDPDFIVQASGIRRRHVIERDGILDIRRMTPRIPARPDDALSAQAEFGLASAKLALADAGLEGSDIDMVICASSHLQRLYPAIAIEIQQALGAGGNAVDVSLGCSSAAAGLHLATSLVRSGAQRRVLVVTPELITGHLNFRDRQTHFIFGDASVSMVVEAHQAAREDAAKFEVLETRGATRFSSNIRSNFGYLNRAAQEDVGFVDMEGNQIRQAGPKVFKEVTAMAHRFMADFLADQGVAPEAVRRFWLHQANARMNALILRLVLGHDADDDRAPVILGEFGNTAAAGAILALATHHADMQRGETGLLCTFGAGYSLGAALLRRA